MISAPPIRVAVVDDSLLMRRLIAAALSEAPDIAVVGTACDAREARDLIRTANPDVVTLDVAMPGMSGIDFLRKIMELRPTPVIMVSNLTAEGAELSVNALQIGAIDVVQKPQGPDDRQSFATTLQSKVRLAAQAGPTLTRRGDGSEQPSTAPDAIAGLASRLAAGRVAFTRNLVAIGASTGGVSALSRLLAALPDGLPPILVVQHMPKDYPERFAARLRCELKRDVAEARDGETLGPGAIRISPGDRHLRVQRRTLALQTILEEGPPVSGHCPSVDVLFESVALAMGARAIGVILTGMGRDGAIGLSMMHRAGAACLGQDRDSSVVWGMPRAASELGALTEEAPLDMLAERICHYLTTPSRDRTPET
jgi:two-component system, chemotaxis family, protein-glutamate methylesterase/glutaminase